MTAPTTKDFEHGAKLSTVDRHPTPVLSQQVVEYLKNLNLNPAEVLSWPITYVPAVDENHPLTAYFLSSSHNTYLLAHQLYGSTDPVSYTHVISKHCRCVEIDAWDSEQGPKVTHGWTLTKATTFRAVCEAIVAPIKDDDWPVMVSLECHATHATQLEMVKLMKEIWGPRLVDSRLEGVDEQNVTPGHLKGRILLIVEHHVPKPAGEKPGQSSSSSSSPSSDSDGNVQSVLSSILGRKKDKPKHKPHPPICDELAALGVYANSVKVHGEFLSTESPIAHLFNISEAAIAALIPGSIDRLARHNMRHQCRVYPKGTRISSNNLDPLKYWRAGVQIAALNWQNFDKGMQLNSAMFEGTNGWVLKPASLLRTTKEDSGSTTSPVQMRLVCDIFAASNLPRPQDVEPNESLTSYVRAELMHSSKTFKWRSKSFKGPAIDGKSGMNPLWNERVEWVYNQEDLVFFRFLIVEDKFGIDEPFAVFCARVDYLQTGWRIAKLLDLTGQETGSTLLVHFSISRA